MRSSSISDISGVQGAALGAGLLEGNVTVVRDEGGGGMGLQAANSAMTIGLLSLFNLEV